MKSPIKRWLCVSRILVAIQHLVFTLKQEKLSYKLNIKGMKRKIEVMLGHFFLNEEERVSVKKNDDLLGLSPIFTLLFEKIN